MKKYKWLLGVMGITLALSACGKTQPVRSDEETVAEVSAQENADEIVDEEPENKEETTEVKEEAPTDAAQLSEAECMTIYQDFLADKEKLHFDRKLDAVTGDWSYVGYDKAFVGQELTLSELLRTFNQVTAEFEECPIEPHEISYAFLDCGKDGIPELAVAFCDVEKYGSPMTDLFVMKAMPDGKLQLVYWNEYGYRTDGMLYKYGMYTSGGSASAASMEFITHYIDADGEVHYLYNEGTYYSIFAFYLPDNEDYERIADEQGIADDIVIEQLIVEPYSENAEYTDYMKDGYYTYYPSEGDYNFYDGQINEEIYQDGNPYKNFWDCTGLPLVKPDELQQLREKKEAEFGITEEIRKGELVEWTALGSEQVDALYAWKTEGVQQIMMENPSWEYYAAGSDAVQNDALKLEQISAEDNGVVNTENWFAVLGIEQPSWDHFSDGAYSFDLYGGDEYYPYMMDITENATGKKLYELDFTNYYKPDNCAVGDESFVEESIHWANITDDILYVCTSHNTYASSASHNAYITAFDMKNDMAPLWKTEPLTCNAGNFEIYGDYIICGYGFTDEPDYIYVLDRSTGKRVGTYPVRTGPEYFHVDGNTLYVNTYDTDYTFELK